MFFIKVDISFKCLKFEFLSIWMKFKKDIKYRN